MAQPNPEFLTQIQTFQAELAQADQTAVDEMVRRWRDVEAALVDRIESISEYMEERRQAGEGIKLWRLVELDRFRSLLRQVRAEVGKYNNWAAGRIDAQARDAQERGLRHADELTRALSGGRQVIRTSLDRLGVDASERIAALARAGGALEEILSRNYGVMADAIANELILGTAEGRNPRETARQVLRRGLAQGLNHVLLVSRDQQIRNYRETVRQTYDSFDFITGYMRIAAKNSRTCMACIALDGTIYATGTLMAIHPQDRCAMIPLFRGEDPPQRIGALAWFQRQDPAVQDRMMGPIKAQAWRAGMFTIKDLAEVRDHPVWGPSARVKPLKRLIDPEEIDKLRRERARPRPPARADKVKPGPADRRDPAERAYPEIMVQAPLPFSEEELQRIGVVSTPRPEIMLVESEDYPFQPLPHHVENRYRQFEASVLTNGYETAMILNPETGEEILIKKGDHSSVSFSNEEVKLFFGNLLSHNHPNGSPLSPPDIITSHAHGMRGVRAVGRWIDGTDRLYYMQFGPSFLALEQDVVAEIIATADLRARSWGQAQYDRLNDDLDEGEITYEEFQEEVDLLNYRAWEYEADEFAQILKLKGIDFNYLIQEIPKDDPGGRAPLPVFETRYIAGAQEADVVPIPIPVEAEIKIRRHELDELTRLRDPRYVLFNRSTGEEVGGEGMGGRDQRFIPSAISRAYAGSLSPGEVISIGGEGGNSFDVHNIKAAIKTRVSEVRKVGKSIHDGRTRIYRAQFQHNAIENLGEEGVQDLLDVIDVITSAHNDDERRIRDNIKRQAERDEWITSELQGELDLAYFEGEVRYATRVFQALNDAGLPARYIMEEMIE